MRYISMLRINLYKNFLFQKFVLILEDGQIFTEKKNPSILDVKTDGFLTKLERRLLEGWSYLVDAFDEVFVNMVCITERHTQITMTHDLDNVQVFCSCSEQTGDTTVTQRV